MISTRLLAGCLLLAVFQSIQAAETANSFQLITASDGRVYRIDTRTGKTELLEGTVFREIAEVGMPQLVIGRVYRGEDGKSTYRYLGEGKFESWGLDRYFLPDATPKK